MYTPWEMLNSHRGTAFSGEWPTIPEMFAITAGRFPDRRAFTTFSPTELSFTYNEVAEYLNRIANYLVSRGIKKGDRIVVTGKNAPEWSIAYLAVLQAGAVVVPIDNGITSDVAAGLIEHSESRFIFSDKDKYQDLKNKCPEVIDVISLSPDAGTYILDLKSDKDYTIEDAAENDLAAILYTSGTTGNPKGVMLTHKNFSSDVWLGQGNLNIFETDVFYALLPIHHSYTMTSVFLEAIFVGAEIVFGKQLVFTQIKKDFQQGKITMFLGVPLLFNKLINGIMAGVRKKGPIVYGIIRFLMSISGIIKKIFGLNPGKSMFGFLLKQAGLDHIRICISGGGPLAPSTFKKFNQLGIDFVQGYGLTESAPMLALNPKEKYKETSVGKVLPMMDIKIQNPDADGIGDILAKGPNIMQGYYKNEEATTAAFTDDGYLKTGDAGYLDRDNYLYLTGRKSSLIVTEGGKNVYPEELEDAFQLYDQYEQILVKGFVKDKDTMSEGIEILFYPSSDFKENKSDAELQSFFEGIVATVNKTLVQYKRIERVHILKEPMPMTTTKKIKRNEVAKLYTF